MSDDADALDALRRMIEAGGTDADGRLPPERDLAERLGVGRRAVRSALDVLAAEGLVVRRQGQGTFAGAPPRIRRDGLGALARRTSPGEVMEVRCQLEPILARLAAVRASGEALDRIARLADRSAEAATPSDYERWDSAFHRAIAEAAGNALFLAVFDAVNKVREETAWSLLREAAHGTDRQARLAAQHRAIVDALAARDPRAADAAMRNHLQAVEQALLAAARGEPVE